MRGWILPVVFIGIPLIEIALFVQIGGRIGIFWTIIIVITTAIAGTSLLRMQGLAVARQAQKTMESGGVPVDSLIDGLFLLIAGILLLTPGFLTDFIGFLFFVPPVRHSLGRYLWAKVAKFGSVHFQDLNGAGGPSSNPKTRSGGMVIEGEIVEEDPTEENSTNSNQKIDPDSPWRH